MKEKTLKLILSAAFAVLIIQTIFVYTALFWGSVSPGTRTPSARAAAPPPEPAPPAQGTVLVSVGGSA